MHPLIPDDYVFVDHRGGAVRHRSELPEVEGRATEPLLRQIGLTDALYSLGIANPGAVTLHNFPRSLPWFERDGEVIDTPDDAQGRRRPWTELGVADDSRSHSGAGISAPPRRRAGCGHVHIVDPVVGDDPVEELVHAAQSVTPLLGEDRAIVVRTQLDGELDDDVTHPVLHDEGRLIVVHGPLVVDIAALVAGPASADESGRLADEATDQALELVQSFLGELGH